MENKEFRSLTAEEFDYLNEHMPDAAAELFAQRVASLPPEARAALRSLLREIAADARVRAEKCWRTHKAPMAAYWKAVAVYAGHASRIAR